MDIEAWSWPQKQILDFFEGDKKYIIADGTVRAGKTSAMFVAFLIWANTHYKGHQFLISCVTTGQIRDILIPIVASVCEKLGVFYKDLSHNKKVLHVGKNKFILNDGLNEGSRRRLQGRTLAGAYCDEAALMPQQFLDEIIARCSILGAKIAMSTNPEGGPNHPFKKRFIDDLENISYISMTMMDNPVFGTNIQYIDDITKRTQGTAQKRRVFGLWASGVGVVYPFFTELDPPDDEEPSFHFMAIDHARSGVLAALVFAVYGNVAYVIDEFTYNGYEQGARSDSEFWLILREWCNVTLHCVVVDPAAVNMKLEIESSTHIPVIDAQNDIAGTEHVNAYLTNDLVLISPGCTKLVGEMGEYEWDPRAAERGEDAVIKTKDHLCDALRYGATWLTLWWNDVGLNQFELPELRSRQAHMDRSQPIRRAQYR